MPSSTWKIVHDPTHLYFITTAAIRHQPIFEREVIKRILVDCLNTGRVLGRYQLYAFVIMQNHIHLILKPEAGHRVDAIVCAYKKASAGLIVRHLAAERRIEFVPELRADRARQTRQRHAVCKGEYQAQNVFSRFFLWQTMRYLHNNPLQSHWRLAARPKDYWWSSAGFYLTIEQPIIPVSDARRLFE